MKPPAMIDNNIKGWFNWKQCRKRKLFTSLSELPKSIEMGLIRLLSSGDSGKIFHHKTRASRPGQIHVELILTLHGVSTMFGHTLKDDQKLEFLSLAQQFIATDGQLTGPEMEMLTHLKTEMNLHGDLELPDAELRELLKVFDTKKAKATVLLEILRIGYSDREFSPAENVFVLEVADVFGISVDEIGAMKAWVRKHQTVMQEAQKFFED